MTLAETLLLLVFPFLTLTVRGGTRCLWSCHSKVWGFSELPCRTKKQCVWRAMFSIQSEPPTGHHVCKYSILPINTDTLGSLISICFLVYSQQQQCPPEVKSLVERCVALAGREGIETRVPVLALTPVCNLWMSPAIPPSSAFSSGDQTWGLDSLNLPVPQPTSLFQPPGPMHLLPLPKRPKPMPIALMRPCGRTRRLFLILMTD